MRSPQRDVTPSNTSVVLPTASHLTRLGPKAHEKGRREAEADDGGGGGDATPLRPVVRPPRLTQHQGSCSKTPRYLEHCAPYSVGDPAPP